ncbi:MAG: DUF2089 domain-containing protein [candidate division Zixibacteria bacterium]|jgi:hypothetical protein|nr:DUF2089 domain-containing protein [candidate division Zixibacteria bacterium]
MKRDWAYLTSMTGGKSITIRRVAIDGEDIAIDGEFELPPLARLKAEDQVFVAVFVKSHGSIKQMEKQFGISYPTVKSRLNRIAEQLDFVDVETVAEPQNEILDRLDRGEISVEEALNALGKRGENG